MIQKHNDNPQDQPTTDTQTTQSADLSTTTDRYNPIHQLAVFTNLLTHRIAMQFGELAN